MELRGRRVLVTGADGFIGSHLTERLLAEGCRVRALACYQAQGGRGWLDHLAPPPGAELEVVPGDVRDPHQVRELVRGTEVVFHLAALIGIPYSYHAPDSYVEVNVKGTLNVLQAAREAEVARVVHTSTSEVYGSALRVPITEDHPLQAQSPYAATKVAADQLALAFHRSFGTPVTVLRPFNTYGPRQSARAVIPTIIAQLAAGREELRLGAVETTRDFNYVADTVEAFLAAARSDAAVGEVVHVGTGHEVRIAELARLLGELMGREVRLATDPRRLRPEASEVTRLCADASKARRLLGWSPRYGGPEGLRRGLEETVRWFLRHGAGPAERYVL